MSILDRMNALLSEGDTRGQDYSTNAKGLATALRQYATDLSGALELQERHLQDQVVALETIQRNLLTARASVDKQYSAGFLKYKELFKYVDATLRASSSETPVDKVAAELPTFPIEIEQYGKTKRKMEDLIEAINSDIDAGKDAKKLLVQVLDVAQQLERMK